MISEDDGIFEVNYEKQNVASANIKQRDKDNENTEIS